MAPLILCTIYYCVQQNVLLSSLIHANKPQFYRAPNTLKHTHPIIFSSYLEPERDLLPKPFCLPSLRDDGSSLDPPRVRE